MGVYDQIRKAFQDLIAPELHGLRGEIRLLDQKIDSTNARIDSTNDRIDGVESRLIDRIDGGESRLTVKIDALRTETVSLKAELLAEIRRVDTRVDGLNTRIDGLDGRIAGLDQYLRTAIEIRERLAALEARRPA